MASLLKKTKKVSAYRDPKFSGTREEYEIALRTSATVYVGNLSFYTTEEQICELFSRVGETRNVIMGLDRNTKTPCGFCFVVYFRRVDAGDAVKLLNGTRVDGRIIRVDFDRGFQEGRQWGGRGTRGIQGQGDEFGHARQGGLGRLPHSNMDFIPLEKKSLPPHRKRHRDSQDIQHPPPSHADHSNSTEPHNPRVRYSQH